MAYRRTERVLQHLAARHDEIVAAAREIAAEAGLGAVQIAPVAQRAGIAAGTVYRYFPAKSDLVQALVEAVSAAEIAAFRRAADAAPGPLSALAAGLDYACGARVAPPRARLGGERRAGRCRGRRAAFGGAPRARGRDRDAHPRRGRGRTHARAGRRRRGRRAGRTRDRGIDRAARSDGGSGRCRRGACEARRRSYRRSCSWQLRALGVVDARARGLVGAVRHAPRGQRRSSLSRFATAALRPRASR